MVKSGCNEPWGQLSRKENSGRSTRTCECFRDDGQQQLWGRREGLTSEGRFMDIVYFMRLRSLLALIAGVISFTCCLLEL